MKITSITPQKKNKGLYNVYVDESFFCSLDDESVYQMKLKEGMDAEQELLEKAAAQSAYRKALSYSLHLLAKYSKTKMELMKKLKEKEYDSSTIDNVINRLMELGYINDEVFVETFIRSKTNGNQTTNKKTLYNKLLQKGIDRDTIENSLTNADIDEYEIAMKAAEKKLKSLKGSSREKKAKLYAYLYSKGFDYEVCSRIVNNIDMDE